MKCEICGQKIEVGDYYICGDDQNYHADCFDDEYTPSRALRKFRELELSEYREDDPFIDDKIHDSIMSRFYPGTKG